MSYTPPATMAPGLAAALKRLDHLRDGGACVSVEEAAAMDAHAAALDSTQRAMQTGKPGAAGEHARRHAAEALDSSLKTLRERGTAEKWTADKWRCEGAKTIAMHLVEHPDTRSMTRVLDVMRRTSPRATVAAARELLEDPASATGDQRMARLEFRAKQHMAEVSA